LEFRRVLFRSGGDWLHSNNAQVFRGFFEGRYLFDSVSGFLHYATAASAGNGFGPASGRCADGTFTTSGTPCGDGSTPVTPLLLYLQGASGDLSPATDAAGASDINNEDFALFWQ